MPRVTTDDVSEMMWTGLALLGEVGVFCSGLKSVLPVGFEKPLQKGQAHPW